MGSSHALMGSFLSGWNFSRSFINHPLQGGVESHERADLPAGAPRWGPLLVEQHMRVVGRTLAPPLAPATERHSRHLCTSIASDQ